MKHRQDHIDDGVLFTETRKVQCRGHGDSLFHNVPSEAASLLGLEKGDEVEIEIRQDSYVVRLASE